MFVPSSKLCLNYDRFLAMWTPRNLKLLIRFTTALSIWMGACSALRFLYATISSFVFLTLRKRLSSWRHTDLFPIGGLIVVGEQAYHRHVVSKLNGVGVVRGHTVVGEQGVQEGTKPTPLWGPWFEDALLAWALTTWGRYERYEGLKDRRKYVMMTVLLAHSSLAYKCLRHGLLGDTHTERKQGVNSLMPR